MRYPNIIALILVILGASVLVLLAISLLWPSSPPPPPEVTKEVTHEITHTLEPTTAKEETINHQRTAPSTLGGTGESGRGSCSSGSVLYQADWSRDMDGWVGSSDWGHTDSMLTTDGSPGNLNRHIVAPCQPPTTDYALEAEIKEIDQCTFGSGPKQFGLIARGGEKGGILAGADCGTAKIASTQKDFFSFDGETIAAEPFAPGGDWHVYRLEVQGDEIRLLIDGAPVLEKADNRNLTGTKVGMLSNGAQINVRSFKIVQL